MIQDIRKHIKELIHHMSKGAYEREEVIALSLLSALSGESIFLLGLPGVGKSMVARRLKSAFKDSTCFEYLMSRFSTPDEIFGPVSISKLKDEDTYERCVDGYLPTADVIFLDEIWKAGPAIQNSLLTALNEKIFHNGKEDIQIPLKGIIAASNELPAEDEGLEALGDRFLIRYVVQPINDKGSFYKLIGNSHEEFKMPESLTITDGQYKDIQEGISQITIPDEIMEALFNLRTVCSKRFDSRDDIDDAETGVPYVSDRRWKKIVGVLRASAYLNGRSEVDFSDCLLLEHMIWDKDAQMNMIKKDIAKMVDEELRAVSKALNVNPNYKAAVLTALNIAEKLMDNTDMTLKLQTENYQLDNDVKHYIQLWEQSKKQVTDLKDKMSSEVDRQTQNSEDQKKLQEKLVEMENAYFDLQMENVNLKNELKSIKRLNSEDEF